MRTWRRSLGLAAGALFALPGLAAEQAKHVWEFESGHLKDRELQAVHGGLGAVAAEAPQRNEAGMVFSGKQLFVVDGVKPESLPPKEISVEVFARIDRTQDWGGLFSFVQDNGSYEKGWLLGFKGDRFMWQVSNGPKLINVFSEKAIETEQWVHVVGTYDGARMALYVNGELAGSGTGASGDIEYPPKAFYTLGSYKDDNENYPLVGGMKSARLYDFALTPEAVARRVVASGGELPPRPLPFGVRPHAMFLKPGVARVRWEATVPGKGMLAYGESRDLGTMVPAQGKGSVHEVTLDGLKPNTKYFYRLAVKSTDGERMMSPTYELDTHFDYTLSTIGTEGLSKDVLSRAEGYLRASGRRTGVMVVTNVQGDQLVRALAARSRARIVGVSEDVATVQALRKKLYAQGVYGSRVTIRHVGPDAPLPFTAASINLVVNEAGDPPGTLPDPAWVDLLVPGNGVIVRSAAKPSEATMKGWREEGVVPAWHEAERVVSLTRPPLDGAADWSHQYGTPANTTSTSEQLGGARATGDLAVQWVGRPGGDFGTDRQPRMPAPLSVNGRLYHQGMDRMIALDQYNGTVAWSLEIPDLRRVNIPRDSSNWCADSDRLYMAVRNRAWVVDASHGSIKGIMPLPQAYRETHDWGWIAVQDGQVFGSTVAAGSYYTKFFGKAWYDEKSGTGTHPVCSDSLFSYRAENGAALWQYKRGLILNPTITVDADRVYFVENPTLEAASGIVADDALWKNVQLVALDRKTGKRLWERSVSSEPFVRGLSVYYLLAHPKRLVLVASNQKYHIYGLDPETGELIWNDARKWFDDHHSGHIMRPVIVADKLYLQPNGFNVLTGEHLTDKMGRREGCHTYVGAGSALIFRGTGRQVSMWDPISEKTSHWPRLRPSCWLSVIPAGGMLLVPEGGGGCSCGTWIETSLGLMPTLHLDREEDRK